MSDLKSFDLEAYIRALPWHEGRWDDLTLDDVKTTVAGNLRHLFAELQAHCGKTAAAASPVTEIAGKRYMHDARGALMPIETIKAMDLLIDETVRKIIGHADDLSQQISRFRGHTFDDIGSLQALIEQQYQARLGRGQKGNLTLTSYDGCLRVTVNVQDRIEFGPELQAAKKLVDECLGEWAADSRAELRALVTRAFQVDQQGQINRAEIFMLMRAEIHDERWLNAMQAVRDSMRVIGSKTYVRFGRRERPEGKFEPITIDLASA